MQKICILILFKCQFKFIFICRDLFIVYAEGVHISVTFSFRVERSLNCIVMDLLVLQVLVYLIECKCRSFANAIAYDIENLVCGRFHIFLLYSRLPR